MSGSRFSNWRENADPRSHCSITSAGSMWWESDPSQKPAARHVNDDDPVPRGDSDVTPEGRRIYLGNLEYSVQPPEIEAMLRDNYAGQYEQIHISVDPFTGRNPSYCFIDFPSREEAEKALSSLGGAAIRDRQVKVGPCVPKTSERRSVSGDYKPTFQRWGDWNGNTNKRTWDTEQGPYGALNRLDEMGQVDKQAPRVYVGGLGMMINQVQNDEEVRGYFAGFSVKAISKRITPHPSTKATAGNHHYCFVDLETREDAKAAVEQLNGKRVHGGNLKVQPATRGAFRPYQQRLGDIRKWQGDQSGSKTEKMAAKWRN